MPFHVPLAFCFLLVSSSILAIAFAKPLSPLSINSELSLALNGSSSGEPGLPSQYLDDISNNNTDPLSLLLPINRTTTVPLQLSSNPNNPINSTPIPLVETFTNAQWSISVNEGIQITKSLYPQAILTGFLMRAVFGGLVATPVSTPGLLYEFCLSFLDVPSRRVIWTYGDFDESADKAVWETPRRDPLRGNGTTGLELTWPPPSLNVFQANEAKMAANRTWSSANFWEISGTEQSYWEKNETINGSLSVRTRNAYAFLIGPDEYITISGDTGEVL